jgi:hypothetical protein
MAGVRHGKAPVTELREDKRRWPLGGGEQRYLDRNAVRAGLVQDPTTYPWSSCAAYALGMPNPVITLHPSYLALSPYAKVRQRQYRALLAPSADPQADARDARWTTQRAVGSPAFTAPYVPRRGRRRMGTMPSQNQDLKP